MESPLERLGSFTLLLKERDRTGGIRDFSKDTDMGMERNSPEHSQGSGEDPDFCSILLARHQFYMSVMFSHSYKVGYGL